MPTSLDVVYAKLKDMRLRTDLKLRKPKYLKDTYVDFDGVEKPLKLRYYQVQGVLHLVLMKRFLLGDDTGLGKCARVDTLVLSDKGLIPLGDIAPNVDKEPDTFYDLDQPVQVWTGDSWVDVKRFYYSGIKPTKKIITNRGYEIEGTLVHPLLSRGVTGEGFVKTRDLLIGDYLCLNRMGAGFPVTEPVLTVPDPSGFVSNAKIFPVPSQMNPELAKLLGYIVAEAWTNTKLSIHISQYKKYNPETFSDIQQLCEKVFGWVSSTNNDEGVFISSVYIRKYLKELGIAEVLSAEKKVPPCIFQSTRDSIVGFLKGYFDGEASIGKGPTIEVSSASEQLLKDIQILLLRLGIVCSRKPKKIKGRVNLYWRLTICGKEARKYKDVLGFTSSKKQALLEQECYRKINSNLDVIPYAKAVIDGIRRDILDKVTKTGTNNNRKGSGLKQFGVSFEKTLNGIRNGGRNPTYESLRKILEIAEQVGAVGVSYQDLKSTYEHNYFYDPVEKIEDAVAEVADLEVGDLSHCFVGNGFINHNTIMQIAALCSIWEKEPDKKVMILTTKSAAKQWYNEFFKFTSGIRVILCKGSPAQREAARALFEKSKGPTAIIMGYRSAVQDFRHLQNWENGIVIYDEATAFKNTTTQVHQVCRHLASKADRVYGLTATMIKNNLMEGYGIYQVIMPGLFGMSKNQFMLYYCLTRMQKLPRSNRQIPVIVGYLPAKIQEFKGVIDPYFIGRPKHEVATELPSLTTQVVEVEMSPEQESKYAEALAGLLTLGEGDDAAVKEVSKLTAISYCQEIVNHLGLIDCIGESGKLDTLVELLTEGEFEDEKIIIFSRFRKMVDIIMGTLAANKIKAVRITGSENTNQRDDAMAQFQDPKSDVRVICITAAGSESLNLQAAKAVICYDTPWSAGDFLQLIGRMIRIGSIHDRCFVVHLVARSEKKKTIDHRVMEVLGKKMQLIEAVLGKRIKGEGDQVTISAQNEISDLFASLKQDAKESK